MYEQFALFCFSTISLTVGDYIWLRVGSNINAKRSGSGNFQLSKKQFFSRLSLNKLRNTARN